MKTRFRSTLALGRRSVPLLLLLAVAGGLAGCAASVAPLSSADPSDPAGRVGGVPPYRPTLDADPPEASPSTTAPASGAPAHHMHGPEAAAASEPPPPVIDHTGHEDEEMRFACPMHPDVHGHDGERCPLCNMKLVPRKEPPK